MSRKKTIVLCLTKINVETQHEIFLSVYKRVLELDYRLILISTSNDMYYYDGLSTGEGNIFYLINYKLIDGIILLSETIKEKCILDDIITSAKMNNIPLISIDKYIEGTYNISFSYAQSMEKIVRHIVEHHKCKRVNFIAGMKGNSFSEERLDVYKKVLTENNIPIEEDRIGYGDFWDMPTAKVMKEFFNSPLPFPEAIICANDTMALCVCDILNEHGYKIPDDVIVTGFDGIIQEHYHIPRLTTAKQNNSQAGLLAVNILNQLFNGENPSKDNVVYHDFIISDSCGCVKHDGTYSNKLLSELSFQIDNYRYFQTSMKNMLCIMNNSKSIYELLNKIPHYIKEIYANEVWICICKEFLENANYHQDKGYNSMKVICCDSNNNNTLIENFNPLEMIPNIHDVLQQDEHFLLFSPLHLQEKNIGYIAVRVNPTEFNFDNFNTFNDNLSTALEIVQTREHLKNAIARLEDMYLKDYLTGLLNRRGFYQRLEDKLYLLQSNENLSLMVISIDLNGLKYINDTFGHDEGDNAIKITSNYIMCNAINDDICARFGGDEFMIANIIENTSDYPQKYVNGLKQSINYYNDISNKPYKLGASCGICVERVTSKIQVDDIIKKADDRMYTEKKNTKYNNGR